MPAAGAIKVKGLAELQRDLKATDKGLAKELKKGLREAGEEVREVAESKAVGSIGNIGPRWSRMRLGVTGKVVYIAPKSRRRGGSPRPNLGPLLLEQAMQPALDEKRADVERKVEETMVRFHSRHDLDI